MATKLVFCTCRNLVQFVRPEKVDEATVSMVRCFECRRPVTMVWEPEKEKSWISYLEVD